MRKRWLLGRPRAPSAPPTRLRHQTRPSPSPSCGGALTPLLDRRVRDPFAARCHAAAAGFPSNCRNLNFYEPHRPPPPTTKPPPPPPPSPSGRRSLHLVPLQWPVLRTGGEEFQEQDAVGEGGGRGREWGLNTLGHLSFM